jgi:dienelactone hydrolase
MPLPYLPAARNLVPEPLESGELAYAGAPSFEEALSSASPAELEAAFTSIEKISGPVLLVAGADDRVWPSRRFAELAMERLRGAKRTQADDLLILPGAGHAAVELPGEGATELTFFHPVARLPLALGGTPEANARAQARSWARVLAFLRACFPA